MPYPLGRNQIVLMYVYSLFWGNNRKYMLIYAKTISSYVRKVSGVGKVHMFLGTL